MIPKTFEEWHRFTTVDCQISLTRDYIASRLAELRDPEQQHTQNFRQVYGDEYWQNVMSWHERAQAELQGASS